MIDWLLSNLAWYRRLSGGTWYFVRPISDRSLLRWVRFAFPYEEILDVESYHG